MKTNLKQTPEQKALATFGMERCVRAYELNVKQGEGGTVIEIETGIPQRSQGVAIRAGGNLLTAMRATRKTPYKVCFRGFGLQFLQDFYVKASSPERAIERLKLDAPRAEVLTCVEVSEVGQVFAEEK